MQEVVKQISERLVQKGHKVTVATSKIPQRTSRIINGVKIKEFDISGNMVRGLKGDVKKYQEFLLNSDFNVVTNFAAQQWTTDLMLPILGQIKAKKVFVPTGFSALYNPTYKEYFKKMEDWMKWYDMNIFLSYDYRDINFAKKAGVKKIKVIPNGASEEEFLSTPQINIRKLLNIPPHHFLILLVGSHTGKKGHIEAMKIFTRSKINNATLLIIANSYYRGACELKCKASPKFLNILPSNLLGHKKIIVAELPRQQTIAAYQTADLFLFPSQIECSPLVLFESMASKTPFLTTDVGNSKEIIKWSKSGVLLPTIKDKNGLSICKIKESAKILENLYNNPQKRQLMAKNGFSVWKKSFTWNKITKEYLNTYEKLMNKEVMVDYVNN